MRSLIAINLLNFLVLYMCITFLEQSSLFFHVLLNLFDALQYGAAHGIPVGIFLQLVRKTTHVKCGT